MKSNQNIDILTNKGPKKMLVLKFVSGPLKKSIVLDPEEMPIIFGKPDPDQEAGHMKNLIALQGEKISTQHFSVDYDKIKGTIMLNNLNTDTKESCGIYKMLF